ncbi:terminase [Pseudomonas sp. CCC3.1]|uniref:terminase n=1 Tax=Pseudomonas sp. CCC3.1 TaxID=3048607 RepID=UPI002AC9CE33|nr:terminase [Pseudomonas sp. CCC3.1]MEB0208593.1 terminase [Pseudomonas sp. CCC3.1]WPX37605.1 terminase [Pseudomonas sp. CCC3.1]
MGKRHPNLPAWQWRSNPQSNHSASHQALSLIAVPMMVLAFLLLASGVFSNNAPSAVIGLVALFAGMVIQRQSRQQDAKAQAAQRSKTF